MMLYTGLSKTSSYNDVAMTRVRVRKLCRDGVYARYTKECAEEYLREISEIGRGSEMRYRSRTWGNKHKDLSGILSESYRERARIGVRMCSGRYRNVIGMLSGYVRDEIRMGAEWERDV